MFNGLFTQEYFYLRQRIPIFIYIFYSHLKNSKDPRINKIIQGSLTLLGGIITYSFIGFIIDIYLRASTLGPKNPFYRIFPLNWSYPGLITWGAFFLIYYTLSKRITHNKLHAFTLATLATVGGGWLYEIAFFHPTDMFIHYYSLYYIDGQLLTLLLLAYELMKLNFKPNRLIYATLALFLVFSGILYVDEFYFIANPWLYRLPASLFLVSLLGGIKCLN